MMQVTPLSLWERVRVRVRSRGGALLALVAFMLASAACAPTGAEGGIPIPNVNIGVNQSQSPSDVSTGLQIVFMLTILTLAPSILIMVTSFTRTVIVLSLIRNAIGVPQLPPNQILIGLSLFLSFLKLERPRTSDDIPTYVLIPSFVISELKTAFQMGFLVFVPFLII